MLKSRPDRFNLIPSIADLFFCTVLFFLFFSDKSRLLADCDTGYHIRAGEHIIRTLSVPKTDLFSLHTPALPWTAHEWLSEVIMAAVHNLFGLTGIVAFFALLLAGTFTLLFKMLRWHDTEILVATAVTVLVFSSAQIHWLARPHVFSFLLTIAFQHLLETWRRDGGKTLYLLPPLMLLWVNLHGGFLGGFILMGAYLAGALIGLMAAPPDQKAPYREMARQLSLTVGACLIACLMNPNGYHILLFPFRLVSDRFIMDHVIEFLPPNFHEPLPFKYMLLLLIAIFALSRKAMAATELLLILIFTNMALYSARYIPLFALVVAPILTRHSDLARHGIGAGLAEFFRKRSENIARIDARASGYFWSVAAVIVVAGATIAGSVRHGFDEKTKPVAAVEFLLREKIAGPMFNNDEFGDYLIYRAYPQYRVFFDGRSDMYGADRLREYCKINGFEAGWEQVMEKYRITWVFLERDSALSRFLAKDPKWVPIYSDEVASILVRDLPQHKRLIERHRLAQPAPHPGSAGAT